MKAAKHHVHLLLFIGVQAIFPHTEGYKAKTMLKISQFQHESRAKGAQIPIQRVHGMVKVRPIEKLGHAFGNFRQPLFHGAMMGQVAVL